MHRTHERFTSDKGVGYSWQLHRPSPPAKEQLQIPDDSMADAPEHARHEARKQSMASLHVCHRLVAAGCNVLL